MIDFIEDDEHRLPVRIELVKEELVHARRWITSIGDLSTWLTEFVDQLHGDLVGGI